MIRFSMIVIVSLAAVAQPVAAGALQPPAAPQAADAALSRQIQREIDEYVAREMKRQRLPGIAIGVFRHGAPLYRMGYGLADLEWNIPVGPDTLMQTGSLGKQFVATAILKLAEEGSLGIDDEVAKYFPEAPESWAHITIAHLLSHTSGIGTYDEDELTRPGGAFDYHQEFTEDQLAAGIAALPVVSAPGAEWRYNNANYVLLGILIHRVTGQFYGDYLRTVFFEPLGMRDTRVVSDTEIITRRASGYEIRGGALQNQAWVSATFNSTADGTIYSTIDDMGRWERALSEGRLLSPTSMQRMWTPAPLADGRPNSEGYGFGWMINTLNGHRRITHNGAWQGFTSTMARYPESGLSVVVFANLDSSYGRPDLIARVVAGLVEPALMPPPSPALQDDAARNAWLRTFLVRAANGEDLTEDFVPGVGYAPGGDLAKDVAAALPAGWETSQMVLVRSTARPDGSGRYSYRIGPETNSRLFTVALAASGRIAGYGIGADPDGR